MATVTLKSSGWSGDDNGGIQITYTASNGTLKITEIKGKRGDGYRSWNADDTVISVSVGGTKKTISLSHYVDFGASSWVTWGATDTSWTGLTGTSIKISTTMQDGTPAYSGYTFTGNATMSWTKYTITYNANGGSGAPSADTKTYGTALTLDFTTIPTRTGYTFLGYSTSSTATTPTWTSDKKSYTTNASDVLYAVWQENKLTVNYYGNNATYAAFKGEEVATDLVHSTQFYYDNSYPDGLANIQNVNYIYLSRTGYAPTGYWGTSSDGGILVNQNTSFDTGQALAQALGKSLASGDASINIYAQWQENAYVLTYDSNGGFGEMSPQTIEWGELFTLSNNAFKRAGYKFIGWNAYRNNDDTWYATGQGWLTEDEITTNGYSKKLYENQCELTFDTSWIKDNEEARLYTMCAVWEMSGGIVYIDNGITFEPYLPYIDNGTSWELYLAYVDDGTSWKTLS